MSQEPLASPSSNTSSSNPPQQPSAIETTSPKLERKTQDSSINVDALPAGRRTAETLLNAIRAGKIDIDNRKRYEFMQRKGGVEFREYLILEKEALKALLIAIINGDLVAVQGVLSKPEARNTLELRLVDLGIGDPYILTVAVLAGHFEIVKAILETWVRPTMDEGSKLLLIAAEGGYIDIGVELLAHCANFSAAERSCEYGSTVYKNLHSIKEKYQATYFTAVTEYLVSCSDKGLAQHENAIPPLQTHQVPLPYELLEAASVGDIKAVEDLKKRGADWVMLAKKWTSGKDGRGRTALYLAARNGHAEVVKMLLRGAPEYGYSHWQSLGEHVYRVSRPLTIDVREEQEDNFTPLFAAVRGCHIKVVEVILDPKEATLAAKLGRETLARVPAYRNALRLAIEQQDVDMVRLILTTSEGRDLVNSTPRRHSLDISLLHVCGGIRLEKILSIGVMLLSHSTNKSLNTVEKYFIERGMIEELSHLYLIKECYEKTKLKTSTSSDNQNSSSIVLDYEVVESGGAKEHAAIVLRIHNELGKGNSTALKKALIDPPIEQQPKPIQSYLQSQAIWTVLEAKAIPAQKSEQITLLAETPTISLLVENEQHQLPLDVALQQAAAGRIDNVAVQKLQTATERQLAQENDVIFQAVEQYAQQTTPASVGDEKASAPVDQAQATIDDDKPVTPQQLAGLVKEHRQAIQALRQELKQLLYPQHLPTQPLLHLLRVRLYLSGRCQPSNVICKENYSCVWCTNCFLRSLLRALLLVRAG